jgi:hypothetical protein
MINSVNSRSTIAELTAATKPAKAAAKATTPAPATNEGSEPAAEEIRETATQKSTEALRSLANREANQGPTTTVAQTIVNSQYVQAAYQGKTNVG